MLSRAHRIAPTANSHPSRDDRRPHLRDADLIPDGRFEDFGQSTSSMMTDGYVEAVTAGAIVVNDPGLRPFSAADKGSSGLGLASQRSGCRFAAAWSPFVAVGRRT